MILTFRQTDLYQFQSLIVEENELEAKGPCKIRNDENVYSGSGSKNKSGARGDSKGTSETPEPHPHPWDLKCGMSSIILLLSRESLVLVRGPTCESPPHKLFCSETIRK